MKIEDANVPYKRGSHLTYRCNYHVVFCPKYRRPVLVNGVDVYLKILLSDLSKEFDFDIIEMEVMSDHVHILVDVNPRFGIMNLINRIKGISSRRIREKYPELKKRLPCLWTRSTFISSVGCVELNDIRKYIENQKGV